jgi:hypothetical protein
MIARAGDQQDAVRTDDAVDKTAQKTLRVIHIPTLQITLKQHQDLINAIHREWDSINTLHPKKTVGVAFLAIDDTIQNWAIHQRSLLLKEISCYYVVPMFTKPLNTMTPHVMAFAREMMLNNLAVPKILQPKQYIIL